MFYFYKNINTYIFVGFDELDSSLNILGEKEEKNIKLENNYKAIYYCRMYSKVYHVIHFWNKEENLNIK